MINPQNQRVVKIVETLEQMNLFTGDEITLMEDYLSGTLEDQALEKLDEREQQIITMRFGLRGGPERTQKEVADVLGISQSYISRLEKRIISRLKREILRML